MPKLLMIVAAVVAAAAPTDSSGGAVGAGAGAASSPSKLAAISILDTAKATTLQVSIGSAQRSETPLFGQDRPWEPRLDNACKSRLRSVHTCCFRCFC